LTRNGIDVCRAAAVIDVLTVAFFGTLADIGGLRDTLIEAFAGRGVFPPRIRAISG
jgi:hypothetical protein